MVRNTLLLWLAVLVAGCGASNGGASITPGATLTLVPSTTPQVGTGNPYAGIPAGTTAAGYPTLGAEGAPVEVVEYGSYDSRASRAAHDEIFNQLIPRIERGEVRYVFVPLSGTGTLPNGAAAARAALCAGEQDAFWAYHDRLYALQAEQEQAADVFSGANLLDIVDALGLDRDAWNECALGERPEAVLRQAAADALDEESYTGTPTILVNGGYVLNELFSINEIIDQLLAQVDDTGAVAALPTPDVQATATPDIRLNATLQQAIDAPVNITLPEDWTVSLSDVLLLRDVDAVRTIPFTLYKGPVEGGTGSIVLLWGFPNVTTGNPLEAELGVATPVPNLRIDGLRLLRLAVVEQGCNVGTDLEREYPLGGQVGVGTEWSAVDCPELPDTRGWFVGVRQFNLNFIFFAYVEPIDPSAITEQERIARQQVQSILDTVTFIDPADMPTTAPPPAATTPDAP